MAIDLQFLSGSLPQAELAQRIDAINQLAGPSASMGALSLTSWPTVDHDAQAHEVAGSVVTLAIRMNPIPTSVAHLMTDATPLVTFTVRNMTVDPKSVRLSSMVDELSWEAVTTGEVPGEGRVDISQFPVFRAHALKRIREATRASLRVRFDDLTSRTTVERTVPIWMTARTTAFLWVPDPATGRRTDLTHFLAAWVTPNAPSVLELLGEAARKLEHGVVGYQRGELGVDAQVEAIFLACKERNIAYVNTVLASAGAGVGVQRVRLPSETLKHRAANCIDGTLLFASLLEAASLAPAIVVLPGHALVGYKRSIDAEDYSFLETTNLVESSFEQARLRGEQQAGGYRALAGFGRPEYDPRYFRIHSIPLLRRLLTVIPME